MTSKQYPGGRPIRKIKRGIPQHVMWPREGFVVPRLNTRTDALVGGCGFLTGPADHSYWLETWAKKK